MFRRVRRALRFGDGILPIGATLSTGQSTGTTGRTRPVTSMEFVMASGVCVSESGLAAGPRASSFLNELFGGFGFIETINLEDFGVDFVI